MELFVVLLLVLLFVAGASWVAAYVFADLVHVVGCLFTGRCEKCGLHYIDCDCG